MSAGLRQGVGLTGAAALLLAGATSAPLSSAAAQDAPTDALVEYTVRPGDTCAAIARRFYGDPRRYDRIHAHNRDLGPPPHRLEPGTVLLLPRADDASGEPDARVTAARRDVQARAPTASGWRAARPGLELHGGWQVATHDRSSAELRFRDDSELSMREHTLVVVYGGSRRLVRTRDVRATLERGALRSRLSELAGTMEVDTPSARTTVGAGSAVVAVAEDGTSRVSNLGGDTASVTAGRASVRVPPGTGTAVRRGGRPEPPRRLPDPPRWAQDQAGRFVGLTGRGGTIRGRWIPVEGASRHRVEVASRPDGGDVVAAVEVPGDAEELVVHRLPPGTYYVSVSTIDRELFEGRPSPRRAMTVLSARIIPPGGAQPVEEEYDPGDPSRPWTVPRVLPGTWVVAPVGLRCGPAEGELREMWTLREPGVHSVRCADARGREVPAFDVEVVSVSARVIPSHAVLARHRTTDLTIAVDSPLPLAADLVVDAPPGVTAGMPRRRPDGHWTVPVTATGGAPDRARLTLSTAAADERVPLAAVVLPVRATADPSDPPPEAPPASAPSPASVGPGHALARVPLPNTLSLDDTERAGTRLWLAAAAIDPGGELGRLRTTAGARAQLVDTPLRLGFAWSFDALAPTEADRGDVDHWPRGAGDVRASVGWVLRPAAEVDAVLELDGWIPTTLDPAGLDDPALLPSLSLAWTPSPGLTLRARQGVTVSVGGDATVAWTSATGLDLAPLPALALRAEVGLTAGGVADRDVVVVAPAAGLALELGWLEAALALRWPLGDGHRALMGGPTAVGSLAITTR